MSVNLPRHRTLPLRSTALLTAAALLAIGFGSLITGCKRSGAPRPEFGGALSPPLRPVQIWKEFSGEKAFAHTKALCDFGPRPAGSKALEASREYIETELKKVGWTLERQEFIGDTPNGKIEFINLIARFSGVQPTHQEFILCSHYDTKLYHTINFVGASDGASSTGALLEMARVLAMDPDLAWRAELVFFDGEEAIQQFTETDGLYGSRYYAKRLGETGRVKQFRFGVLWDMIGDANLTITLPPDSPQQLAKGILAGAEALGYRENFGYHSMSILDDHVPLNAAGIPTIDLIDFDYPYWHTADDTLDKISPVSLQKVGAVTLWLLRQAYPR